MGVAAAEIISSVKPRLARGVVPFGNMFVYLLHQLVRVRKEAAGDNVEVDGEEAENSTLWIAKLKEGAVPPRKATEGSAGFDVFSAESFVLQPGERRLVSTGWQMVAPPGTYLRVAPRSGLAVKAGIDVLAGVVDEDFRGEVKVILINLGNE